MPREYFTDDHSIAAFTAAVTPVAGVTAERLDFVAARAFLRRCLTLSRGHLISEQIVTTVAATWEYRPKSVPTGSCG